MNQSLLNLFQIYELCQQQSQCYLLIPPPQPPIFPKLINSSSTLINFHQRADSLFIILGIFIALLFTCFLLLPFAIKFQFYDKLRQYYHRTKGDRSASFSNVRTDQSEIISTSYNSLTPLTTITNQSPSFTILQQHLNFDNHCISRPLTPYYYTYDLSPSKIICQNCFLATLHRKPQCLCHNFFVPIK